MADALTPLPVKTKTAGDVTVKVVDSAGSNILAVDASGRPTVNVNGTVTVDTELPAAGALGDSVANPTTPTVGSAILGWNVTGAVWKRVRINDSDELVVTTSGTSGAPTDPKTAYATSSGLAAAGSTTLNGTQISSGKTGKLTKVTVASSVPCKWVIQTVLNAGTPTDKVVLFTSAANLTYDWTPPHMNYITQAHSASAGLDAFCVTVTNMDNTNSADVYATIQWDEV